MTSTRTQPRPEPAHADERELIRAAKAGDLSAFEALVVRNEQRIYGLARRLTGSEHEAQDVTQQTFLSAIRSLDGFEARSSFATWLTTIAVHAALKVARKRRGLPTESLDAATEPDATGEIPHPDYIADWRDTPDRLAERNDTGRLLDEAIAELDAGLRAIFLLRDVEGLSVRETAAAVGISEANVKVRLLRARLKLRERLTRAFGDDSKRFAPGEHS